MIEIKKYELTSTGIDTCKGKLIPGIVATWGEIIGDIDKQSDLVAYVSAHAGITPWGQITGNLSDQTDLMNKFGSYATKSWVSSQQFATESWVSSQGYLVSDDLSQYATRQWVVGRGYATQSWVEGQGYLTAVPAGYATESWVQSQGYLTEVPSEYATQSWVTSQFYLTSGSTTITDIESRLSSIEATLGQAVQITNEILS